MGVAVQKKKSPEGRANAYATELIDRARSSAWNHIAETLYCAASHARLRMQAYIKDGTLYMEELMLEVGVEYPLLNSAQLHRIQALVERHYLDSLPLDGGN